MVLITEGISKNSVKYHLALEDNADSHTFALNHFTFVKLWQGKTKTYILNFNHPQPTTNTLAIVLDGKYGDFEACVKVNGESTCRQSQTIDAHSRGLSNTYKRLLFDVSKAGKSGTGEYKIELNSKTESSGLIMGAIELSDSSSGSMLSKEIKAGMPVTDFLPFKNHSALYHFHVSKSMQANKINTIRIHLTPVKGQFLLAVSNDGSKPTPEKAGWTSFTDEVTITSDDPMFQADKDYIIGVYPVILSEQAQEYQYQIKWTYLDKHDVLSPGLIEHGTMIHTRVCYVAEMLPNYNSVMFVKGGH